MRIDKYLKVTHIIKRREVAKKMLDAGFVSINDKVAKPASDVKVGDIVNFKGGTHYVSSWKDAKGYKATAGKAKITLGPDCKGNGKAHPWHLIHTDNKSNIYGWVIEGTFS